MYTKQNKKLTSFNGHRRSNSVIFLYILFYIYRHHLQLRSVVQFSLCRPRIQSYTSPIVGRGIIKSVFFFLLFLSTAKQNIVIDEKRSGQRMEKKTKIRACSSRVTICLVVFRAFRFSFLSLFSAPAHIFRAPRRIAIMPAPGLQCERISLFF